MNLFQSLKKLAHGSGRAIPSLDGVRCLSILFVLASHLGGTGAYPAIPAVVHLGHFGVRVFFVISGYLITSILLSEMQETGSVLLKRFYFRRTLRLFPASYAFVLVMAVLAHLGVIQLFSGDLAFAATYTMNYHEPRAWGLGHLWSLAIEEQFYLLWPACLLSLGVRRAGRLLTGLLFCAPLIRIASPYLGVGVNFLMSSDCLGTGCMLALFRPELEASEWYRRILKSRWVALAPVAALAANYIPSTKVTWLAGETLMNVAIAISLDWAIRNRASAVGRFLNVPAVSFIGVLSYSLYLWQQPFLNAGSGYGLCRFPANLVMVFAAALVSYSVWRLRFCG